MDEAAAPAVGRLRPRQAGTVLSASHAEVGSSMIHYRAPMQTARAKAPACHESGGSLTHDRPAEGGQDFGELQLLHLLGAVDGDKEQRDGDGLAGLEAHRAVHGDQTEVVPALILTNTVVFAPETFITKVSCCFLPSSPKLGSAFSNLTM